MRLFPFLPFSFSFVFSPLYVVSLSFFFFHCCCFFFLQIAPLQPFLHLWLVLCHSPTPHRQLSYRSVKVCRSNFFRSVILCQAYWQTQTTTLLMGHPTSSRSNPLSTPANTHRHMESSVRCLTSLDPCSSSILHHYSFVMVFYFYFYFFFFFMLLFCNFCCVLLSLLFFVGYCLPAPTWIDFVASVQPSTLSSGLF
jgi:hypothetical protein